MSSCTFLLLILAIFVVRTFQRHVNTLKFYSGHNKFLPIISKIPAKYLKKTISKKKYIDIYIIFKVIHYIIYTLNIRISNIYKVLVFNREPTTRPSASSVPPGPFPNMHERSECQYRQSFFSIASVRNFLLVFVG